MATLNEMRLELRTKVGSPNPLDTPNATLDRFINEAYREIGTKHPFHETRCIATMSTVSGTSRYNLPDDCVALRAVWDSTNGRKLRKAGARMLAERSRGATERYSQPTHYIRAGRYIELLSAPDGLYSLTIYYNTHVATLVEDDDEPVIPATWHPGIVLLARYKYWDEFYDVNKAQYSFNAYKLWLADKPSEMDMEKAADLDSSVELPTLRDHQWRHDSGRAWHGSDEDRY